MEVICNHKLGTISLSQCRYITMILDCFGLKDSRSVSTPLETNAKLVKVDNSEVDIKMYQSALGGLMYAMLATRPDLAYAVGALSKHAACPGQAHFAALKQVYHYLRRTTNTHLIYRRTTDISLLGYVDADWAGDVNDHRSVSGYTFVMTGAAISWLSKKQTFIALSSTIHGCCCCREGSHLATDLIFRNRAITHKTRDQEEIHWTKVWVEGKGCFDWQNGFLCMDGSPFNLFQKPGWHSKGFYDRKSQYSLSSQVGIVHHRR